MNEKECTHQTKNQNVFGEMARSIEEQSVIQDQPSKKEQQDDLKERATKAVQNYNWQFEDDIDFDHDDRYSSTKEMFQAIKQFVFKAALQTHESGLFSDKYSPHTLTILGPSDVGKSHLSRKAMAFLGAGKGKARFINIPKYYKIMTKGSWDLLDEEIKRYNIICIDDMKSIGEGQFLVNEMYGVTEYRRGRWTIFTSNHGHQEIEEIFGKQILTRLFRDGGKVIELDPMTPSYNMP